MSVDAAAILDRLLAGEGLSETEAAETLRLLASGADHALAGAILAALRAKGETAAEIRGFASAMRELATAPPITVGHEACDLVGTGGDGAHTFNLSTGASLLAAAAGVPIVKHGARSVSSKSGSADVLEELGLAMPPDPSQAERLWNAHGFMFLFAPAHHPAMAAIRPVRKSMGVRTIFNILGPLTNPAAPPFAVIGAYSIEVAQLLAEAIAGTDIRRAFVIHGEPGWDEATPVGPFDLFDVEGGLIRHENRDPIDAGVERCSPDDLRGGDAAHNAEAMCRALTDQAGPHRDALCLAAGLAQEVTGRVEGLGEGVEIARGAIDDGRASKLLEALRG